MDLTDHLRVLRANWWKVLIAAIIVGAIAYGFSATRPNVYQANQLLSVASVDATSNTVVDTDQIDFRASFYAAVANTPAIAAQVQKSQNLKDLSVDAVQSDIHVTVTDTTGIMEVRADGRNPAEAVKIATGTSSALKGFITAQQQSELNGRRKDLQSQIASYQSALDTAAVKQSVSLTNFVNQALLTAQQSLLDLQPSGFQVQGLTVPIASNGPVSPRPKKAGLLGFLVALVLVGEGIVVFRAFGDRFARTNDVEQITSFTGLPVLAMVPRGRGPDVVEAFRTLRTNLMFLEGAGRPRTIAIVSPNPGAGKSFSAVHLAESAVAVDATVVLIDADLRRPVLHSRLRSDREPGLSNALRGADLQSTLHRVDGIPNLKLLPSGSAVNDTVGVLGGRAFRHVLDSLDSAELVVVDTPPGAVYADALAVAAQCDATLLVLDSKSTRRRAARTLIDSLERTGATLIGVVVNNAQVNRRDTYERG
ncbi:MAG TPA: Wzz/FepE/Etk N-terminal domain-containing protein [Acidimicrobiia bacterium]|nr:Wzz/FepE/Etk N-terminal domain-containing protein [Acidimicrobiia bacterium]